jgi:hypothetical protein
MGANAEQHIARIRKEGIREDGEERKVGRRGNEKFEHEQVRDEGISGGTKLHAQEGNSEGIEISPTGKLPDHKKAARRSHEVPIQNCTHLPT